MLGPLTMAARDKKKHLEVTGDMYGKQQRGGHLTMGTSAFANFTSADLLGGHIDSKQVPPVTPPHIQLYACGTPNAP